jgi:hypothetical protein
MIGANEHRISFDRDGTQSVNLRDRKWLVIYDGSSEAKHSEQTMLIGALIVCLAGALFLDGAGSGFCIFLAVVVMVVLLLLSELTEDEDGGLGDDLLANASPVAAVPMQPVQQAPVQTFEQQQQQIMSGGHGSVRGVPPPAPKQREGDPARAIFASMRFKGGAILPEAKALQLQLQLRDVDLQIIDMNAGGDIDTEVFSGIEFCDSFLVFGTAGYGEDTGNPASTFFESKFAQTYV